MKRTNPRPIIVSILYYTSINKYFTLFYINNNPSDIPPSFNQRKILLDYNEEVPACCHMCTSFHADVPWNYLSKVVHVKANQAKIDAQCAQCIRFEIKAIHSLIHCTIEILKLSFQTVLCLVSFYSFNWELPLFWVNKRLRL